MEKYDYRNRPMSPKEVDQAVETFVALGLGIGILTTVIVAVRKKEDVGRVLDDTQLSLDYLFDDELALYNQSQPTTAPDVTWNVDQGREDIERAFAAMQRDRWNSRYHLQDYYVDKETRDEYPSDTVFEVYKQSRYMHDAPIELVYQIEGEKLPFTTRIIDGTIAKAKRFGYDLYIFQNGEQIQYVPGVYGCNK